MVSPVTRPLLSHGYCSACLCSYKLAFVYNCIRSATHDTTLIARDSTKLRKRVYLITQHSHHLKKILRELSIQPDSNQPNRHLLNTKLNKVSELNVL